jgi:hypothetical protein
MNKYQPLQKLEFCKIRNIRNVIFSKEKLIDFEGKVQKGNKVTIATIEYSYNGNKD